jgi:uncharacterized damage-inducible protein DinB
MKPLLESYLAGIEQIAQSVAGLTEVQLHERPFAHQWTILEVLCHLADSEGLFTERMKRVLVEDRPAMPLANPDLYVTRLAYHEREVAEELAYLGAVRQQMARILSVQPPEAWARVGIHSKEGERTLEQIVRKAVDHVQHHLRFIEEKRQAMGC